MISDVNHSDDALNRTPRLQPSVVTYGPDDFIPPLLHQKQLKPSLPSFQESFQELMSPDPRFPVRQTLPLGSLKPLGKPGQDSLAASHVGRYTIPPPNNIDFLQAPTPSAVSSPENSQGLPSIAQALASLDNGATPVPFAVPTPIPQFERGLSTLSTTSTGSTPCSHLSPISSKDLSVTSSLSQSPSVMQPSSLTPDTSNMTAYSEASLRGVPVGGGPTRSYSPPMEMRAAEDRSEGLNSSTNMHKCPYPGCTAGAFRTQYLLNSHANVHSQNRPYFCPVAGCPRGIGGKGFKRKNEMIRHGLVHDSSRYVCPFCTDQQHEYPRRDNLQRHVRLHHAEKGEDPLLRDVLAQRPKRDGRRRRRGHA